MIDTRTLKVRAFRMLRSAAGRIGLQVVPKTYYSPIPDLDALPPDVFDRRSALRGIHFDLDEQVGWIEQNLAEAMREFAPSASLIDNASYGRVGADVLHGVVRGLKPRRIVELGSGHSTLFMAAAAQLNRAEGVDTELRTFDPYPSVARPGLPGLASLERGPGAGRPAGGLHVARGGRRAVRGHHPHRQARLRREPHRARRAAGAPPGVLVHVHDIFLPYEYPRRWHEESGFHWAEQYLLQAFLAGNPGFEVRAATFALCRDRPDAMARLAPTWRPGAEASAFWFSLDRRSSSAATCSATAARLNGASAAGSTGAGGASISRATARAIAASSSGGAQPASWPRRPRSRSDSLPGS